MPNFSSNSEADANASTSLAEAGFQMKAYACWLDAQPLAANTRLTYRRNVQQFLTFLQNYPSEYGQPLTEVNAHNYAVRDFKTYLKKDHQAKPTSINLAL